MTQPPRELTRLLLQWSQGDDKVLEQIVPLVCEELQAQARHYLRREGSNHSLETNDLVQEFFKFVHGRETVNFKSREHFFGFAAQTMGRILVDHARKKKRVKRNHGQKPLSLNEELDAIGSDNEDIIALDLALERLREMDRRQATIVGLRFYVGLTVEETAAVLEISAPTVKREWRLARIWLYREIKGRRS